MTEDMKKKIQARHSEEMADVSAYEKLSEEARNAGCHRTAGIIQDIAHEEQMHAEMLEYILDMNEK